MRYNTLFHVGFREDSRKTVNAIKNAGFDGVFFNMNQQIPTHEEICHIRDAKLNIETIHLPYNNPYPLINALWSNDCNVENCISILKTSIDFASVNCIPTVVLHASSGFNPPKIEDKGISNFKRLLENCEDKNIILAVENIKSFSHVYEILSKIDSPNLRLCFDIGHANAFTNDLFSPKWDLILAKIQCIHIHDNDGKNDLHLIPGYGDLEINNILCKTLKYNPNLEFTAEAYYEGREKYYNRAFTVESFFIEIYQNLKRINEMINI